MRLQCRPKSVQWNRHMLFHYTLWFKSTQRLTSARHIRGTYISSANRKTCSDGCSGRAPTSNSTGVATHRPIGLKSVGPRYEFIRAAQLTSYSCPVIDARICDFSGARHMLNQTSFYACPNGEQVSAAVQLLSNAGEHNSNTCKTQSLVDST